jgi:hypothetical protein
MSSTSGLYLSQVIAEPGLPENGLIACKEKHSFPKQSFLVKCGKMGQNIFLLNRMKWSCGQSNVTVLVKRPVLLFEEIWRADLFKSVGIGENLRAIHTLLSPAVFLCRDSPGGKE